jgi:tetraacyldisaccharide 4'-kinase
LYEIGHKKSFRFEVPIINVGNLNIGGSGKTPAVEYLIRLLRKDYQLATLSRGYGRRTRGLRFASYQDNATTLGDEPYQFYRNFNDDVKVVVGEDRAFAIPNILQEHPDRSIILLDDAYQHRRVNPHFNILLTDFEKPFYDDYLLPMGRLREGRKEAARADVVIVTKCTENLGISTQEGIRKKVTDYTGDKPVFFASIQYGKPQPFQITKDAITNKVILLSGIAKPEPLEEYVKNNFELLKHFRFKDHHLYSIKDINMVKNFVEQQIEPISVLTTEKDMVRLIDSKFNPLLGNINCFYLPIEMKFVKNGADFDKLVIDAVENANTRSNSTGE